MPEIGGTRFVGSAETRSGTATFLVRKAGSVLLNGVPTGVEVAPAVPHGGPWSAATDPRALSGGLAAILRFARPTSDRGSPDAALREERRGANPRSLLRLPDGRPSRDPA